MPAPPVSFFVSKFPNPSETFIQAQVEGLLERGAAVEIVALAAGDPDVLGALLLRWPDKLSVKFVPVPKGLGARVALAPRALFSRHSMSAINGWKFGDDASSLRLLIAAKRWPKEPVPRRVWLAH